MVLVVSLMKEGHSPAEMVEEIERIVVEMADKGWIVGIVVVGKAEKDLNHVVKVERSSKRVEQGEIVDEKG